MLILKLNKRYCVNFLEKMMHQPGFEPGSSAWKAPILTTRLLMRLIPLTTKLPFRVEGKQYSATMVDKLCQSHTFPLKDYLEIYSKREKFSN